MTTPTIIIIAIVIGLAFAIVVGGAAFFFLRNRGQSVPPPTKKKPIVKKPVAPVAVEDDEDDEDDFEDEDEDEDDDEDEVPPPTNTKPLPNIKPATVAPTAPKTTATPTVGASPRALNDFEASGEKINILVVDDNPDTRDNVTRLLYFEKDMAVIGHAVNGRDGITKAIELKPHIVLMDINMPDMDGITATGEMAVQAPFSQVIIMSVQAEPHYMRQAMAAGARDFQPKPFTAEELVNCIHRVYKISVPIYERFKAAAEFQQTQAEITQQQAKNTDKDDIAVSKKPPIIAVYSPKGGIGTSTVAVNLAVAFQQIYGDTVLLDADLQFGDIAVHLNTKAKRTISDVIQEGQVELDILSDLVLPHNSGLKLLLAPPQPEYADEITVEILGEVIQSLQNMFKIVVVDMNAQLTERMTTILELADYILVITAPELPAIKNTKLFLELAEKLELESKRIGTIINRASMPGGVNVEQIETALSLKQTYRIPYDPRLTTATRKGVAVVQQDPTAPSAKAIIEIAQQVGQKLKVK